MSKNLKWKDKYPLGRYTENCSLENFPPEDCPYFNPNQIPNQNQGEFVGAQSY